MPIVPLAEISPPDKLAQGKVKINDNFEALRLFVNNLEEEIDGIELTADNITILDSSDNFTSETVEGALEELVQTISEKPDGSPYFVDDGRTEEQFTVPVHINSTSSIAIGELSWIEDSLRSVTFGWFSYVYESDNSISIGSSSDVQSSSDSISFGSNASVVSSDNSISIGAYSEVLNSQEAVSIGYGSSVFDNSNLSVGIGNWSRVQSSDNSVLVGTEGSNISYSTRSSSFGVNNDIDESTNSSSFGADTYVRYQDSSVSIGHDSRVTGTFSNRGLKNLSIGSNSRIVNSGESIVLGSSGLRASNHSILIYSRQGSEGVGTFTIDNSHNSLLIGGRQSFLIGSDYSTVITSEGSGINDSGNSSIINSEFASIESGEGLLILSSSQATIDDVSGAAIDSGIILSPSSALDGGYLNVIIGSDGRILGNSVNSTIIGSVLEEIDSSSSSHIYGSEASSIENSDYAMIVGGISSEIDGGYNSLILGGNNNHITPDRFGSGHNSILGGFGHRILGEGWYKTILGGEGGRIDKDNEFVTVSPSTFNVYARRTGEFVLGGYGHSLDFNRANTPSFNQTGGKTSVMFMRTRTTNATPEVMRAIGNIDYLTLLDRTTVFARAYITASNFDATVEEAAAWELTCVVDVRDGVARIAGTPLDFSFHQDDEDWEVEYQIASLSAGGASDPVARLDIMVTGKADTNIIWAARVELVEVDF